ncbi:MAG: response regulator transcription factor, partial [Acidimicrobiia bacterium]|nr:response regulator transcription factor [Acidimicrobiia bacterium]
REAVTATAADLVEVVEGGAVILERIIQAQRAAHKVVRILDRPPYLSRSGQNPIEAERIAAGVEFRVIYDRALLDDEFHVDRIASCIECGERARAMSEVPLKLMIFDEREAWVPLAAGAGEVAAVVIRPSVLLDSMIAMFEILWLRAVDLAPGFDAASTPEVDDEVAQMVRLLATGMKDEAIARHLGVNVRTVRRRLRATFDVLGVDTRFQAGVSAARLGLLEVEGG